MPVTLKTFLIHTDLSTCQLCPCSYQLHPYKGPIVTPVLGRSIQMFQACYTYTLRKQDRINRDQLLTISRVELYRPATEPAIISRSNLLRNFIYGNGSGLLTCLKMRRLVLSVPESSYSTVLKLV